jgi:hypothetical protein
MNTPPTQTPTPALDPATLTATQCAIIDALPPRADASPAQKAAQRDGALAFLAALLPRNPVEARLATGIVVAHYAAMDCFRRAARDDLTLDLHLRTVGEAIALCRMIDVSMRDLARRQGGLALQPPARPASAQPVPAAAAPDSGGTPRTPPPRARRAAPCRGRTAGGPGLGSRGHCRAATAAGRTRRPCRGLHQGSRGVIGRQHPMSSENARSSDNIGTSGNTGSQ